MPKFKRGDIIEAAERGSGFEWAYVANVYTARKGKFKGQQMYYLKIMNGTSTIPVTAEVNYKLKKK